MQNLEIATTSPHCLCAVAHLCKVVPMAKFKCAPLHNHLNIGYKYNLYES